jgi:hypothetical protein
VDANPVPQVAPEGLRELVIYTNPVSDRGAVALARSPRLPRLRRLELSSCEIGDAGVMALAESSLPDRLERPGGLTVTGNPCGEETADRLRERLRSTPL